MPSWPILPQHVRKTPQAAAPDLDLPRCLCINNRWFPFATETPRDHVSRLNGSKPEFQRNGSHDCLSLQPLAASLFSISPELSSQTMAAIPITGTKRKLSTPEVSTQKRSADPYSTSGLCTRCLELPLEKGLDLPLYNVEIKIADVGTYYRQPAVPSCNLCRLLCDSRITADSLFPDPHMSLDSDELCAFDVAYHNLWVDQNAKPKQRKRLFEGYHSRYLAVVPSGTNISRPLSNRILWVNGEMSKAFSFSADVALRSLKFPHHELLAQDSTSLWAKAGFNTANITTKARVRGSNVRLKDSG